MGMAALAACVCIPHRERAPQLSQHLLVARFQLAPLSRQLVLQRRAELGQPLALLALEPRPLRVKVRAERSLRVPALHAATAAWPAAAGGAAAACWRRRRCQLLARPQRREPPAARVARARAAAAAAAAAYARNATEHRLGVENAEGAGAAVEGHLAERARLRRRQPQRLRARQ
eukprot:362270-Chlamydomonas_euryale.AAC.5